MNKNQSRIQSVTMPLALCFLSGFACVTNAQSFVKISSLPGVEELTWIHAMSDNGKVIVGYNADNSVYRWTDVSGEISLPSVLWGGRLSYDGSSLVRIGSNSVLYRWSSETGEDSINLNGIAEGLIGLGSNRDGTVVFGTGIRHVDSDDWLGHYEGFRWTQDIGLRWLGTLGGDYPNAEADGISDDGSTVYGRHWWNAAFGDFEYFILSEGVLVGLGFGSEGHNSTIMRSGELVALSETGNIVVGNGIESLDKWQHQAFLWRPDGFQWLGSLSESDYSSTVIDISRDGNVVIGSSSSKAFRWTLASGMESLGFLPGSPNAGSSPSFVNIDGSVIVGTSYSTKGSEQFVWTLEEGMRSFAEIFGADSLGWSDIFVDGISGDGTTLFGRGVNPDGIQEGWIATLGNTSVLEFAAGVCDNTGSPTASWHSAETWSPNGLPTAEIDVHFTAECLPTPEEPFVAIFDESGEAKSLEIETGVDATLKGLVPFLTTESITVNGTLGLEDDFQVTTDQISITAEGTLRVKVDSPSNLPSDLNGPLIVLTGELATESINGILEIQIDPAILSVQNLPAGGINSDAPKWPLFAFEPGLGEMPPNIGRFHTVRVTDLNGEAIPQNSNGTIGVMYSRSGIDLVVLNTPRTVAVGEGSHPFDTQPITDWAAASNVTLITHGTNSVPDEWVSTLAAFIDWKSNVPDHTSVTFDWSQDNLSGGVSDLLGGAGNTSRRAYELGESMAFWVDQCRAGIPLNSIHIQGHSSGAWFTEGFAARYAILHPNTFIESTLYDANDTFDNKLYEPTGSHKLGFNADFATHVVDRRSLVCGYESLGTDSTAHILPFALNLDVTPADILADIPVCVSDFCGLEDIRCRHAWPYNWYQANLNDLPTQVDNDDDINTSDPLYWGFMRTFARNGVQPMYQVNMPAMGSTISIYPNLSIAILMEDLFAEDLDYDCESGCCDVINGSFVMAPTCGGAGRGGQVASTTIVINASMPLAAFSFDLDITAPGAIVTASIGGEEFSIDMPSVIDASLPAYLVFDPPLASGNHDLVVNAYFAYGLGEVALSNLALDLVDSIVSCPADLTGDGSLDFFDVSAFLTAFSQQDTAADFSGDGSFDFFDVSAFLQTFTAGCP